MKTTKTKLLTALFSLLLLNSFSVCTFTITTTSISNGYNQHPYSQKISYVNASSGAIVWSISSGSLPPGLSLNTTTGYISGAVGSFTNATYTVGVTATDHAGCIAVKTYTVAFTNYQVLNTDYVRFATQVNNAQQAPYYDDYDMVNNAYNVPGIVGVSPVTVSYPQTWYGNAPTYTVSITNGSNLTAITSGVYTPTVTAVSNVTITSASDAFYYRVGDVVTVSGHIIIQQTSGNSISFTATIPISSPNITYYGVVGQGSFVLGGSATTTSQTLYVLSYNSTSVIFGSKATMSGTNQEIVYTYSYRVL